MSDAKDPALELAEAYLRWQVGSDVLEEAREALHPTPAAEAPAELVDPERDAAAAQAWAAYSAAEAGFPRARIFAAAGSELLQRGQELANK